MTESTSHRTEIGFPTSAAEPVDPRLEFRSALASYPVESLAAIAQARAYEAEATRPGPLAAELTAQLDGPATVKRLLADLGPGPLLALSLFGLTETTVASAAGLSHALSCLGVDAIETIGLLLRLGLLALEGDAEPPTLAEPIARFAIGPAYALRLRVHPSVPRAVRVPRPEGKPPGTTTQVSMIRESDGLEPVLRLGAVWQRLGVEPLRQTQQGTLYKRDQERIEEDPVLADAVSDAPATLPGLPSLWLALALRAGLVRRESAGERLEAAPPDYWAENAVHLPQMIATTWLGLRDWRELAAGPGDPPDLGLPWAYLRPVLLLWLACLDEDEWLPLDEFDAHLRSLHPRWDLPSFRGEADGAAGPGRRPRPKAAGASARSREPLAPLLLGAGYALGLTRAAEMKVGGRPAVQLTPLGRYVLSMGPPPPPRPSFDHFLFVQPNLEIIAYRQGLTPQLVGRLSRFAWWTKLGAASELKLVQESILFGLDGGLTAPQMLDVLGRHSSRPLPTLVPDAIRRWSERREQISFYTAATLLEFGGVAERDAALAAWEETEPGSFLPVADRFLLVEPPGKIPTDRIRSGGARDYRHPPERCVGVEPDGITLVLDPQRSDLLIDAELSRIAELRPTPRGASTGPNARRYVVTAASLERAGELGITASQITDWFQKRTGEAPSPAVRLVLRSVAGPAIALPTRRVLVLATPTEEIANGLLQHPDTADLLGERLGPTTITVPDENLEPLREVLVRFGLRLAMN